MPTDSQQVSARIADANGWYEVKNNPLSKVGVFPYLGSSIRAPDPMKLYNVYRPAAELSKPATLNSLKLLPWIDDHAMLGSETAPNYIAPEQKGIEGVIGENVYFANNIIYGNIKVFSNRLAKLIRNGKVDLSCGYRCKYVWPGDPGWIAGMFNGKPYDCIQTNIIFNHLALVQDGRMGDEVSVLDSADDIDGALFITFDSKDIIYMKKLNTKRIKALVEWMTNSNAPVATFDAVDGDASGDDDGAMTMDDVMAALKEIGPKYAKMHDAMSKIAATHAAATPAVTPAVDSNNLDGKTPVTTTTADGSTATDGKAAEAGKGGTGMDANEVGKMIAEAVTKATAPLTAKIAELETASSPVAIANSITARDALARNLSGFVGTFDHADKTLAQVAKYGAEKLGLDAPDGTEVAVVQAYLKGRVPVHQMRYNGTGMDAANKGDKPNAVADYIAGTKAA
jgi:hypothetical protein